MRAACLAFVALRTRARCAATQWHYFACLAVIHRQRAHTTIFRRQGQYALDAKAYCPADLTVERIGDLLTHDLLALLSAEMTR